MPARLFGLVGRGDKGIGARYGSLAGPGPVMDKRWIGQQVYVMGALGSVYAGVTCNVT